MSDDVAIKVENLTKVYKLYDSPLERFKEALNPLGRNYHKDFYALKDVSFEIAAGDTVAIIGQNGAGKSTLLKIITGIITPTSGSVAVKGKISALLELGAGFNPEITGLENVYFNGSLQGFSKEQMDDKIEEILAFADIGDFIHQPVRIYSSGMFVRLAFAVAVHIEPEILIIDEALAVGDLTFQNKCFEKIKSLMASGVTTLFVTHNMNTVKTLCKKAYMVDAGQIYSAGTPKDVTHAYYRLQREREHARKGKEHQKLLSENTPSTKASKISHRADTQPGENRFGLGTAKIVDFRIYNDEGVESDCLESGAKFSVHVDIEFVGDVNNPAVGVMFKSVQGQALLGIHTYHGNRVDYGAKKNGDKLNLIFESTMYLNPGKFLLNIGIADHKTDLEYDNIDSRHNVGTVTVTGKGFSWGIVNNSGIVIKA